MSERKRSHSPLNNESSTLIANEEPESKKSKECIQNESHDGHVQEGGTQYKNLPSGSREEECEVPPNEKSASDANDSSQTPNQQKLHKTNEPKNPVHSKNDGSVSKFVKPDEIEPQPGDLIEFDRILYKHWALFVGDGKVINVTGTKHEITATEAQVKKVDLKEVAGDSCIRINNLEFEASKRSLVSFSSKEAIENAEKLVGKTVPYNVITKNCEHYVTMWKYGKGWSEQASAAMSMIQGAMNTGQNDPNGQSSQSAPLLSMLSNFLNDKNSSGSS